MDRTEDDYTRLVALNAPLRRPETSPDEVREYAQRRVDVLDLRANELVSRDFESVASVMPRDLVKLFATTDDSKAGLVQNEEGFAGFLTFQKMFADTAFVPTMRELCATV